MAKKAAAQNGRADLPVSDYVNATLDQIFGKYEQSKIQNG
jgi:hypothetical protein